MAIESHSSSFSSPSQPSIEQAAGRVFAAFNAVPPNYSEYVAFSEVADDHTAKLATTRMVLRSALTKSDHAQSNPMLPHDVRVQRPALRSVTEVSGESYRQALGWAASCLLVSVFESATWDALGCLPGAYEAPFTTHIISKSHGLLTKYDSTRYNSRQILDEATEDSLIIQTALQRKSTAPSRIMRRFKRSHLSLVREDTKQVPPFTNSFNQLGWSLRDMTIHRYQPSSDYPDNKPKHTVLELVPLPVAGVRLHLETSPKGQHFGSRNRQRARVDIDPDQLIHAQSLLDILPAVASFRTTIPFGPANLAMQQMIEA